MADKLGTYINTLMTTVIDKEQEKKQLYAKLLSIISDEDRLKYEKALANRLTKKRNLNEM